MCVRARSGEQLIAINSTRTLGRQRFTAAPRVGSSVRPGRDYRVICGYEMAPAGMKRKRMRIALLLLPRANDALRSFIEKTC